MPGANQLYPPPRFVGSTDDKLTAVERWIVHVGNWGRQFQSTTEGDVTTVEGRVDAAETDIATLQGLFTGIASVTALTQTISNPPTQAEVQNIQAKVNELVTTVNDLVTAVAAADF